MKKFVYHITLFSLIVLGIIWLSVYCTNNLVRRNADLTLPNNADKLIIGHSHSQYGLNDSLIDHCKNSSQEGESYFYNYYKLLALLDQNAKIKTVFVEFSNNQIDERMNDWIWEEPFLSKSYKVYAPFIDLEGKLLLFRKNPIEFMNCICMQLNNNMNSIRTKDFDYSKKFGECGSLYKNKVDSILKHTLRDNRFDPGKYKVSGENIRYLKKIVSLCKAKNINVYLIRTPVHEKFQKLENEPVFKRILDTEFPDVDFLDFNGFAIANDEFADLEHLNYKGARKYSVFFNDLLRKGLLSSPDKQKFIDENLPESKPLNK